MQAVNLDVISEPEIEPMLTITQYQQLADALREELQHVIDILPPLDENVTLSSAKTNLNIRRPFLDTAIAAAERHPELQAALGVSVPESRESLQYIDAFRHVRDEAEAFVQRVSLTIWARQTAVTLVALRIYDVAKALARAGTNPELVASVAAMKRDLGPRGPAPRR